METMNRELLKNIRQDMKKAMEEIERKYKVNFADGSARFDDSQAEMKVKFTIKGKEKDLFEYHAELCNVDPTLYNKKANIDGDVYTITQINLKAKKYPIIIQSADGRNLVFNGTSDEIKSMLIN